MTEPLMIARSVKKQFVDGAEIVVKDLTLRRGDKLALVAPSGSGKSTLISMLLLAMRPNTAEMFQLFPENSKKIDIAALWKHNAHSDLTRYRQRNISFVLQSGGLLPFLTARRNIELPYRLAGRNPDIERINTLLNRLGILQLIDRYPAELSVGQRQRVAVARAIAPAFPILLADEPTAALDQETAIEVMRLILDLADETQSAVLIASHDTSLIDRFRLERLSFNPDGAGKATFTRTLGARA